MPSRNELSGWLLDVYPDPAQGLIIWLLDKDGSRRHRLHQPFPTSFYVHGPSADLRRLWRYLDSLKLPLELARTERQDLFVEHPLSVLEVISPTPFIQENLFRDLKKQFPGLTYYNVDISADLRYAAQTGVFPLSHCQVLVSEGGEIKTIETLDSPWQIDNPPVPLLVMALVPDSNPNHREPSYLKIHLDGRDYTFSFKDERGLLIKLQALLRRYDPDLLVTVWGDDWLMDKLGQLMEKHHMRLSLNREARDVERRDERFYHS